MKKMLILGALALMTSVAGSVSHAAQSAVQPLDLFRYDFNCEFGHDDHRFTASARVFADDDYRSSKVEDASFTNLLAVSYEDSLISANAAILNSTFKYVQIQDANGSPSIFVLRPHGHDHDADLDGSKWMKYDAFLSLDDHKVEGFCRLRRSPARGHEVLE